MQSVAVVAVGGRTIAYRINFRNKTMGRTATTEANGVATATAPVTATGNVQRLARPACATLLVLWAQAVLAAPVTPASTGAAGPPAAVIDAMVMPAWLERAGQRQPIFAGMLLQQGDRLTTGASARIQLTLPEGSTVKLGESAQLSLDAMVARREGGAVFLQSALRVLTGAFRFTTNALSKARSRREVDIHLATLTAGIRGTDLWGKQGDAKEIVCLLEGKIEVARDVVAGQTSAPVILDQPMQFYIAPKDQPALPVGRVPDAQLAQWAAETDIAQDAGGASVDGRWKVTLDAETTFAGALNVHDALRNEGYAAQFRPDKKDGRRIYVVQLGNLSSEADARVVARRLAGAGYGAPTVSQ